jgi:predicted secreted Zn-dependent protease
MTTETPVERIVAEYVTLRDTISEKEEKHKEEIAVLRAQLEELSAALLAVCAEQNIDSMRTPAGTASRRVLSRYWTSDWEAMYQFISENKVPWLLEKRINNNLMQQFLGDMPDLTPPGLQADRKFIISVRRPSAR